MTWKETVSQLQFYCLFCKTLMNKVFTSYPTAYPRFYPSPFLKKWFYLSCDFHSRAASVVFFFLINSCGLYLRAASIQGRLLFFFFFNQFVRLVFEGGFHSRAASIVVFLINSCGLYLRAASPSRAASIVVFFNQFVRLVFEGGFPFKGGFYSRKYGMHKIFT